MIIVFFCYVFCVFLQYFDTVGLGLLTCKNRRRVGGDLNHAQSMFSKMWN